MVDKIMATALLVAILALSYKKARGDLDGQIRVAGSKSA